MLPSLRSGRLLCVLLLCPCATLLTAKTLRITSTPPGATIELNDEVVGTTPFQKDFPNGYFRRTITVFEKRLEHPIRLRLALSCYVTQEVILTNGPKQWTDAHRNNHGEYWLFKADEFHFELLSLPPDSVDTSSKSTQPSPSSIAPRQRSSHFVSHSFPVPASL